MSKTPKGMSKEAEASIVSAISDVCEHVEQDGMSPTDALAKVASESDFAPDMIRLIATGYNTGAANFQRTNHKSALDKFAAIPLADASVVIDRLYPPAVKSASVVHNETAVSSVYAHPPRSRQPPEKRAMQKAAHDAHELFQTSIKRVTPLQPERNLAKEAFQKSQWDRRQLEVVRGNMSRANDEFLASLGEFSASLAKAAFDRTVNLGEVRYLAKALFGTPGEQLVKHACDQGGLKWPDPVPNREPANLQSGPLAQIDRCLQKGATVVRLERTYESKCAELRQENEERLTPHLVDLPPAAGSGSILSARKRAADDNHRKQVQEKASSMVGMLIASNAAKNLMSDAVKPPDTSSLVSRYQEDLADPMHENELRAIQAGTMLQDFINNDEVLAGYEPDSVLKAYNEISQLSPRAATQPTVMRPLLRKYLSAGGLETFESREMADIEKTLAQTRNPQPQIGGSQNAPQRSLLG